MVNIVLAAVAQVLVLGTGPQDFDQACRQSQDTRRPLVVLVGAKWCMACQTMQNDIMPRVQGAGDLENVIFYYMDFDQQRQLASRLTGGGAIPQLIHLQHTQAGWTTKRMVGARSSEEIRRFIQEGQVKKNLRHSKEALEATGQSTAPDNPALKKVKEKHDQTLAERTDAATVVRSKGNSKAVVSKEADVTAPPASQSGMTVPMNPPVGQQRIIEPSPTPPKRTSAQRVPFYKRWFRKRGTKR